MFGFEQIDLNPLVAGIFNLGFIYGIFHGNVPRRLAICAEGTNRSRYCIWIQQRTIFRRIIFPVMMRYAIGIGNNWQVLLKATALVSLLGLEDIVKATQLAGKAHGKPFYFAIVCGAIHLFFPLFQTVVLFLPKRRFFPWVLRRLLYDGNYTGILGVSVME